MKIVTNNPVLYKHSSADGDYSGLDGKSSSKQIQFFQNWVNKFRGQKLKEDGKWGSKTGAAWTKYGKDFEKAAMGANTAISSMFPMSSGGGATPAEANPTSTPSPGKLRGLFGKLQDNIKQYNANKAQAGTANSPSTASGADLSTVTPIVDDTKKGMPKGLKLGLMIGVPVLLLVGGYFLLRKKK